MNTREMKENYCDKCQRVTGTDWSTGLCGGCVMSEYLKKLKKPTLVERIKFFFRI